jgi:hypothetical protein
MVAEDRIMPVGAVQRWGRLLAAEAGNDRQLRVMVLTLTLQSSYAINCRFHIKCCLGKCAGLIGRLSICKTMTFFKQ